MRHLLGNRPDISQVLLLLIPVNHSAAFISNPEETSNGRIRGTEADSQVQMLEGVASPPRVTAFCFP